MRFSTILFPLAVLASLVLASPVEERATKLTAVASAAKPKGEAGAVAKPRPGAAVHAEGTGATVAKPGTSKRSDYNELDRRGTDYGTFYLCTGYGCAGYFNAYQSPCRPLCLLLDDFGTTRFTLRPMRWTQLWRLCGH